MDHIPNILTQTIPHSCQSYDTAGDYEEYLGMWIVRISKMKDWRYEALVMIHELIEMILTKNDKVKWQDIDYFDKESEGKDHPDPGTLETAPYHVQHMIATDFEKMLAGCLNVDWEEYEKSFDELVYKKETYHGF